MGVEEALPVYLGGKPGVVDLVANRIHRVRAPQGSKLPRITYRRISGNHVRTMSGSVGLASPRIQIDCWDKTPADAARVADEVRKAMDGLRKTWVLGTWINACFLEDERDTWDEPGFGDEQGVSGVSMDWTIWSGESVPTL